MLHDVNQTLVTRLCHSHYGSVCVCVCVYVCVCPREKYPIHWAIDTAYLSSITYRCLAAVPIKPSKPSDTGTERPVCSLCSLQLCESALRLQPARLWPAAGCTITEAMTVVGALQSTACRPSCASQSCTPRFRQPICVRSRASTNGPEAPRPRDPASNPLQQLKTGLSQLTDVCCQVTVPQQPPRYTLTR